MESFGDRWWMVVVVIVGLTAAAPAEGFNYGDALEKSLLFFEAQRSGKLPHINHQGVEWRGDSGLRDGYAQGVDLVGGYYDAGDHVKFVLPMAFSATMLAWGAIEYRREMVSLNRMPNVLSAIRWATDYFLKAHPQPNLLWAQVGDGESDHYCWERAEDMTTPRTAYKLDPAHPGSDLAAETAAALAAASLALSPYNSSYSNLLLLHAKALFSFADTFKGSYDDSIPCAKQFYPSSGYSDELLWAATWLYRATKEDKYMKYVAENGGSMGGTGWAVREFSWDNKYAGLQILLSKVLMDGEGGEYTSVLKQYKAKADFFACACLQKNDGFNVRLTPGGLVYVREWNNMQYAASAAFLAAVYSDYISNAKAHDAVLKCPDDPLVQPLHLLDFAESQADYILGKNPKSMSYMVGYGERYPLHVHHRGASIPSISLLHSTVGCVQGFETWYRNPHPNPNVLYGGLVGGPNDKDEFSDDRPNYEQTEPTISGTAPLVGLLAKLQAAAPVPHHHIPPPPPNSGYHPTAAPATYKNSDNTVPVQFFHSVTNSWTVGSTTYYSHKVIIKNTSGKAIKDLKLTIEDLTGSIWGLSPAQEKNTYALPPWLKVLKPASECSFVYIQGGPQARVSVLSYH